MATTKRIAKSRRRVTVPKVEPDRDLLRIQELFDGLIRSRTQEGPIPVPKRLPKLTREMLDEREPRWFAVPGMYGGFSFSLSHRGEQIALIAESWCRAVEGSGMRHLVIPTQVILEAEGFQ